MEIEIMERVEVDTESSKFLTFQLQDEEYGLEILKVRELMGIMNITPVPQTPPYVKGVINLRGQVIPVMDLRSKFGLPEGEYDQKTCIVVVDVKGMLMGIVVDTVSEVLDIQSNNIEPPPSFGTEVNIEYILGMGKVDDEVKILLDIEKVLSSDELTLVENIRTKEDKNV